MSLSFRIADHLIQVTSDRDSSNSRVTKLESQVAALQKEATCAKREAADALSRAEEAERKEWEATQLQESLIPQLQAVVNSLSGKFSLLF